MEPDAEPHVRLIAAVRAGSSSRVAAVGRLCASNGTLDKRVHSSHANNGPLLCALTVLSPRIDGWMPDLSRRLWEALCR